jgi:hypothetical protein
VGLSSGGVLRLPPRREWVASGHQTVSALWGGIGAPGRLPAEPVATHWNLQPMISFTETDAYLHFLLVDALDAEDWVACLIIGAAMLTRIEKMRFAYGSPAFRFKD